MSADNWSACPRCTAVRAETIRLAEAAIADSYGKIPIADFDAQRAKVEEMKNAKVEVTFREDYEFYGAEGGEVTAEYHGACSKCGLTCQFEHSVTFFPED